MAEGVLIELSLVVILTVGVAGLMRILKQPLIVGYILTGILVSPYFLDLVHASDTISTLAQIGVVILLFMVGLGLDPTMAREVGGVALIAGLGQVLFTSTLGYGIGILLGFSTITSLYVAIGLTFSSTIIIMKLLSDRGETESLYGRISIGFLLVQDIVAMGLLMLISSIQTDQTVGRLIIETSIKGGLLIAVLAILSLYVLPRMTKMIAKSQEYLLLASIGWCLMVSSAFLLLDFSIEIGALLAGVALSVSPFKHEISSKLTSLRDFFIALFFVLLGSQMVFNNISRYILPIILFSLFILIGNPVIVMALMGMLGYSKRIGFLAGLTVAQISEFSLILISLGVKVGHLSQEILSMVTFIGLFTIAGSTYFIIYADTLYKWLSPILSIFEKKGKKVDETEEVRGHYDAILFGSDRMGFDVQEAYERMRIKFLVVDYDPEIVQELQEDNVPCIYADADDVEALDKLPLKHAKMIVSTIPSRDTNLLILEKYRLENPDGIVILLSHDLEHAFEYYQKGASYVIIPHFLGARRASQLIQSYRFDDSLFFAEKAKQLEYLEERKQMGHHPPHVSYYRRMY